MTKKIRNSAVFLLCLILLQQLLSRGGAELPVYKVQQEIIISKEIDPAVFFYTESEHALRAEKEVRKAIDR